MAIVSLSELAEHGETLKDSLIGIRRDLHMYPELSFEESRTAGIVAQSLKSLGLIVRTGVGGHGIVADMPGAAAGRTIALRADMDALSILEETGLPFASRAPGVMHACGHDAHTAILLGAARILSEQRDRFRGTVRFLFQSAEEINAGAKAMIAEGALAGVDEIYGLHNLPTLASGRDATGYGTMMGSVDRIEIAVEGKGSHGAIPEQGIDPIVAASAVVMGLQTAISREISPFDPAVVTIGSFQSGNANNVIPHRAELTGTIRTFSPHVQAGMWERIERIVNSISEGYRCQSRIVYISQTPVLVGHDGCIDHVNRMVDRLLGEANRIEALPTLAGEDFSVYLEHVPGCFFWLGSDARQNAERGFGLHHPKFDINEDCLATGASLMAAIAMERLNQG